jgi:6-phosphofructokinase 2
MKTIVTLTLNPTIDKSASIDRVVAERKLRCTSQRHHPGGGGINVSRAIHKLGGTSLAIYTSGGPPGDLLRTLLDREEIAHRSISIEEWTRENVIIYEDSTDLQFRFGMPGPKLKEAEWERCLETISSLDQKPDYIVVSGSLPPGVPNSFYAKVAALAKDIDTRMILDTSGEGLRPALREGVFLVKPNLRELSDLAGREIENESDQEETAREMISRGDAEAIVISRGAGGALVVWAEGARHLRAPTVHIQSKVGAGDSMVAGIVLSLARGESLLDAARFGVAAGAAAVKTPGTELCRREDAEALYKQMLSRTQP